MTKLLICGMNMAVVKYIFIEIIDSIYIKLSIQVLKQNSAIRSKR